MPSSNEPKKVETKCHHALVQNLTNAHHFSKKLGAKQPFSQVPKASPRAWIARIGVQVTCGARIDVFLLRPAPLGRHWNIRPRQGRLEPAWQARRRVT